MSLSPPIRKLFGPGRRRPVLTVGLAVLIVLLGTVSLLATHGGPGGHTRLTWRSGAFAGFGPEGDAAFGAWRGEPVRVATDYIGSTDWGEIEDPAWAISHWETDRAIRPELSVALWPATGGSLAEAASGAYDVHFVALARNLVAGGLGGAGIRLGWEFNGPWYRWVVRTPADAAMFAAAWRQIVGAIRSVPGASFSFDWAPNLQDAGVDPALAYPGDAYVSEIGMDVYDWNESGRGESPARRWRDIVSKGYGLAWQSRFAAAHHKPIAFPEWGLVSYVPDPGLAGGDDPGFIQDMFDWFKSHRVAFESYSDVDNAAGGTYYGLTTGNGRFPNATALYRRLYAAAPAGLG